MKLVIDENVAIQVIERLRLDNHELILVRDIAPAASDVEVQRIANEMQAIVLTEDTDFGDIVIRQGLPSHGVILLRLSSLPRIRRPKYVASMGSPALPMTLSEQ